MFGTYVININISDVISTGERFFATTMVLSFLSLFCKINSSKFESAHEAATDILLYKSIGGIVRGVFPPPGIVIRLYHLINLGRIVSKLLLICSKLCNH